MGSHTPHSFSHIFRIALTVASLVVFVTLAFNTAKSIIDGERQYLGGDFTVFYAAARLTQQDKPAVAYDPLRFQEYLSTFIPEHIANRLIWSYPPTMLLVLIPFSYLSLLSASVAWTMLSLLSFVWALSRFDPSWRNVVIVIGTPSLLIIVGYGNTGLLYSALLGVGLFGIANGRSILGGAILSALAFKPHLAVFIPIFLIIRQDYRALFAFIAGGVASIALTYSIFGYDVFVAFFDGIHSETIPSMLNDVAYGISASPYLALRMLGVENTAALFSHIVLAAFIITSSVILLRTTAPLMLKIALVVPTTLLIPIYLFEYDLAALALVYVILLSMREQIGLGLIEYSVVAFAAIALAINSHLSLVLPINVFILLFTYLITVRKIIYCLREGIT